MDEPTAFDKLLEVPGVYKPRCRQGGLEGSCRALGAGAAVTTGDRGRGGKR
jgi:hypothetical protein